MSTQNALSSSERAALLEDLQRLRSDADQLDERSLLQRFLPLHAHERALSRDVMVVRGERGAGKSMLFKTLGALRAANQPINSLFGGKEVLDANWVEGFSEGGTLHPPTDDVARFVKGASPERTRVMWMAHLVGCLAREGVATAPPPPDPFYLAWKESPNDLEHWVDAADRSLSQLTTWLDAAHGALLASEREVTILYDHLDKIGTTAPSVREQATASLLALWLSLSNRYRALRAKIFVREDLFEASLSRSADASKLRSRSIALTWDVASLYRLLVRQMAAQSPRLRAWIGDTINNVPLQERAPFGWFPPDPLREIGRPSQAAFVEHLAGKQMGKGVKKGFVYRWIPDRLQDARGAIVPRSMINLVAYAADDARHSPKAGYTRLLHPHELQAALENTSRQRVDELAEEHVVVYRLGHLRDRIVPIDHSELVKRLSMSSQKEDGFEDNGSAVADELARLGVLREREGRRWDVPDIYRYGYGIKRKGGVVRPR
ncbi:MAG TPA: hypothetical protein VJT73_20255 [Polyangiaceae bacterium]|nr:hypothetical protein [Polyangiaceae bacterium]